MISRVKVIESKRLTPTTHDIKLEKPEGFDFQPVQFCGLELATSEGSEEYPMSLACSPTKPYLEFGARIASGSPWKRAFAALRPGDEVEIDGAYGHFVLDASRDALFVAGGIGITPLKGMLESMADTGSPRSAVLVYSNKSADEIAYREELEALARADARISIVHTLTREPEGSAWKGRRGRIDPALLREALSRLAAPVVYVCGTPSMVRDGVHMLDGLGVSRDEMRYELFPGYA